MTIDIWLSLAWGFLIPVGFFLLAWSGMEPQKARDMASWGPLVLALATLGYFGVGYAFHLGGAAYVYPDADVEELDTLRGFQKDTELYWGFIGLEGFFLSGEASSPQALALFLLYLPLVVTAVLLPTISLAGRTPAWQPPLLGFLVAAVIFPLAACWVWGGGWLATLGQTIQRGHGLVDYAGSGVVYLLGGMVTLGGLVALGREQPGPGPARVPPAHFPLLANLGTLLILAGWLGWSAASPFHAAAARLDSGRTLLNGLLGTTGATLSCLVYCWLTLGYGEPLMVARGAAAGLVTLSAGAPFIPPWAALLTGVIAGLLLPLGVYLFDHLLRLSDGIGAFVTTGLTGIWGLLAAGLFADGLWGQGWNGIGAEEYLGVTGLGVAGPILGSDLGQVIAQVAGIAFIGLLGFAGGWGTLKLVNLRLPRR